MHCEKPKNIAKTDTKRKKDKPKAPLVFCSVSTFSQGIKQKAKTSDREKEKY